MPSVWLNKCEKLIIRVLTLQSFVRIKRDKECTALSTERGITVNAQ